MSMPKDLSLLSLIYNLNIPLTLWQWHFYFCKSSISPNKIQDLKHKKNLFMEDFHITIQCCSSNLTKIDSKSNTANPFTLSVIFRSTDYGHPFFHQNPKLLGVGRQFGKINFGRLGYFRPIYQHPFWYCESLVHGFH